MKKITALLFAIVFVFALVSCGKTETKTDLSNSTNEEITESTTKKSKFKLDYENEVEFEKALNAGENVTGKTCKFVAFELHPDSMYGYNVWSGEHLNFISDNDPGIKEGQTVTAKIEKAESIMGSWFLKYKILDLSEELVTKPAKQNIVVKDVGYTAYMDDDDYCITYAVTYENPNKDYAIAYPNIEIVYKSSSGAILGTDEMTVGTVAAGATMTYAGYSSCDKGKPDKVEITVTNTSDDFELQDDSIHLNADIFTFANISTFDDDITAEIKNNSSQDFDSVAVYAVYYKDGKLLGGDCTYIDNVLAGSTKAIEVDGAEEIKDYDKIELFGYEW